jgi:hypothetical protein
MWETVGMSCRQCEGFSERRNFNHPHEYRDIARRLMEVVEQGTFVMVRASCPLRELLGPVWPGDMLEHVFECIACGSKYRLSADTWHGSVNWRPVDDEDSEFA